ncbi:hypothetical protein [Fibrella aquatica]|uniref:hypothetical protein n=1 Tax=Fibrella aquatica TaxID=3242487 RepID=UPI0035208FA2
MKKLYFFSFWALLVASTVTFGQSPIVSDWNSQPQFPRLKRGNAFPVIDFSVSVPLFKRYTQSRQQRKSVNLPNLPPLASMSGEEGIAWTYYDTGEVVVVGRRNRSEPYVSPHAGNYSGSSYHPSMFDQAADDGGSGGGNGGDYSSPYDNDKKPKTVEGICTGLMTMLALQKQAGKEAAAFVTTDGKVIILPMSENTETESATHNQYEDSEGHIIVNVYQEDGKWMVQLSDFSTSPGTSTVHQLAYHVHTHPQNGNQNIPSPRDKIFAGTGYPGLSKYIINNKKLVRYDENGTNVTANLKELCPSN